MNEFLKDNERIDDLQIKDLKIIQHPNKYCFTSDAVLLANYTTVKRGEVVADLGTGSGVIALLLAVKSECKQVYGIEIQNYLADMASRSVTMNNLDSKITIMNMPMQQAHESLGIGSCDVAVCNPPYKKLGDCKISEEEEIAICKHEIKANLDDVIKSANRLLKFGGRFYMVHLAERLTDILITLRQSFIEPKTLIFTHPQTDKPARLVLIEAIKGGGKGINIMPPLIMNNDDGTYTTQVRDMYNQQSVAKKHKTTKKIKDKAPPTDDINQLTFLNN
ncbi:MAG: tRNA1(Val) (adenine(37)-N6)-methyltransferase [Clostridia bacterium]|jgi:tRNA1Val (adenine37-N6)-methyltransferase|nr:tRNA1(Val) (adenine(37)-N6)-methyltransferase [Clostridia bacterium]MDD4276158.1 tRNA1(Val) (adenine(37)-N6)-methyltransferase [Clostridia bacterium]